MNDKKNFYDILGLSKNASLEEIKKKYDELVMEFHPDINKASDASEKFTEIQNAYNVLSDSKKKYIYDQKLNSGFGNNFQTSDFRNSNDSSDFFTKFGNFFSSDNNQQQNFYYSSSDSSAASNFNQNSSSGFHNFFDFLQNKTSFFNNSESFAKQDNLYEKNSEEGDISFNLILSFEEACLGKIKKIEYQFLDKNKQNKTRILNINIDSGIQNGQIVIFQNAGNYSDLTKKFGKLFLKFLVKKHPLLELGEKEGQIKLIIPINFMRAFFGCTIIIPTLFGNYKLKVPPRILNNKEIVLPNMGIPKYRFNEQINIIKIVNDIKIDKFYYNKLKDLYSIFEKKNFFSNEEKVFFNKKNK